jgi:hypothetical protein
MIMRCLWFAGVFGLSVWMGAHWDGSAAAAPPFEPAAVLPFDPAAIITRPFHAIWLVLSRGG